MERLEGELERMLERRNPPGEFTERLMSRVRGERRRVLPAWRWAAAGALAASLLVGVYVERRQARLERERAGAVRDELVLGLEIAGAKINKARRAVLNLGTEDSL